MPEAFAIEAVLMSHTDILDPLVARTIAIRDDQTLDQLHEALRLAFGWADPHLYSFWLTHPFWYSDADYTSPFALEEAGDDTPGNAAEVTIGELRLRRGKRFAYLFDFGEEWQLALTVVDRWKTRGESYPMLVEAEGIPSPQYEYYEEDIE